MPKAKRTGYNLSLTEAEKARRDRALELAGQKGRQFFMRAIDTVLRKEDPKFLKENRDDQA